jgi:ribose transport system substrate-binding protein
VRIGRERLGRRRLFALIALVVGAAAIAAGPATLSGSSASNPYGETYNPKAATLQKALGSPSKAGVPVQILAALDRAGRPLSAAKLALALKCWKNNGCDTGTGGDLSVGYADGFGENVFRQVSKMEFILQALTYPQIGKVTYTSARFDPKKAVSDIRSMIAQKVDVIVNYPDAGNAVLGAVKEATRAGIIFIPYAGGAIGRPGKDYLTYIGEDVCQLGKTFAAVMNKEVRSGKIVFLGGFPGNPLSKTWQACEKPALSKSIEVVGVGDTNWTQEGTFKAMSGFLSKYPDLKGVSYEYADGFLGGVRAYEAANRPLNIVLTLRTDEMQLLCDWKKMNNPNFKIFNTSGGNFETRIALTTAMMKLAGAKIPAQIIRPNKYARVTKSTCNPNIPGQASASSLVPLSLFKKMYPKG